MTKRAFIRGNDKLNELLADPETAAAVADVQAGMAEMDRVYADTLAKVREASHLTQAQLASALGVSQAAVSQLEKRDDMLLSTLRGYLTAAGAENPRILVTVRGVEMEMAI